VEKVASRYEVYRPDGTPRPPEEAPPLRALRGEEVREQEEIVRTPATGELRHRQVNASPVRDAEGRIIGSMSVVRDITDLKRTESELKRSNAELQQFAYVASHDMQEPLRMVISYLDLLNHKFGDELNPKAKEYMAFAVDGADKMRELVNDLLAYSRVDSRPMKVEEVDLNKAIEEVVKDLHVAIRETNAEIIIEQLPTITADRMRIKQVFQNLITNAIKFHKGEPPKVEISAQRLGSEWEFAVKDNGIGIDPAYQDKIFEMFQRLHTKEEYPGTGIGLAIAKKIVERQGGRIWVDSEPGKGSTFFFTLPTSQQYE
jgi:light-regulated signal transduction histidine kinase (bacteriophytochrome)